MTWSCKPPTNLDCLQRTGYLAGYSDGFHGHHFGSGYDAPPPAYRDGFDDGRIDGRKCGWCGRNAQKVARQKVCSRHPQCTKAVREHRAVLFGEA